MATTVGTDQGLQVYKNYDPGLILNYFAARSNCLLCLYQAESQVSIYRIIVPLVSFI